MTLDNIRRNNFVCPFCEATNPITEKTYNKRYVNKDAFHGSLSSVGESLIIEFMECANCNKTSVIAYPVGDNYDDKRSVNIYPSSTAKQFGDVVPEIVRMDYEEAYDILNISPRASATLARRAIQEMIRDRFNASGKNLFQEIDSIKDQIYKEEFEILDSIRNIGNIGAHQENDLELIIKIEPHEAELVLYALEHLIEEWYIKESDRLKKFNYLKKIAADKKSQKSNNK